MRHRLTLGRGVDAVSSATLDEFGTFDRVLAHNPLRSNLIIDSLVRGGVGGEGCKLAVIRPKRVKKCVASPKSLLREMPRRIGPTLFRILSREHALPL